MKLDKDVALGIIEHDKIDGYEIIYESDWVNEGKYDYQEVVFKHKDKFYSIEINRVGSYHTDYWYSYDEWGPIVEVMEVEPVEVTKIEYYPVHK